MGRGSSERVFVTHGMTILLKGEGQFNRSLDGHLTGAAGSFRIG